MVIDKWLKLILLIVIFVMILFLFSYPRNGSQMQIKSNETTPMNTTSMNTTSMKTTPTTPMNKEMKEKMSKCMSCTSTKSGSNRCKSDGPLLPVMDPRFNMREMCKQSVLLEDHLFQKEKRCHDCIIKHFLTIEGLAEEAITLDKEHKYPELNDIPPKVRKIAKQYIDNSKDPKQPSIIAQELRELRKNMMQDCFDAF